MFNKKRFKSQLLSKYIISYLAIFLIPFVIMSLVIYNNSVTNLQKEIETSKVNNLQQAASITGERIEELKNLATRISYDPLLTPYMIRHHSDRGEAINELKKYKANSSIIDELFLYFHDDEKLYSSSGVYSFDALLQQYQFGDWTKDDLLNNMKTKYPSFYPLEVRKTQEKMIASFNSIIPNNPYPYGTVIYFIKESVLTDVFESVVGSDEGNTYIVDQNNHIMVASGSDKSIHLENLEASVLEEEGINHIRHNGDDYFIATVKSEYNDWTFVTVMNTNQFSERLSHNKVVVLVIVTFLFLFGLILAVFLGTKQYRPISNLFELTETQREHDGDLKQVNELESIHDTFTNIFESHKSLSETVDFQKPLAKEQVLIKLLKGDLHKQKDIDYLLKEMNIDMYKGTYYVTILHLNSLDEVTDVTEHISNLSIENATIHVVDLLNNHMIGLIITADEGNKKDIHQNRINISEIIYEYIKERTRTAPNVGVGSIYYQKKYINHSYIEALAALDYQVVTPKGSIIYFEDISLHTGENIGYPQEGQMKLMQSLKQGDQIVAIEALRVMFAELQTKKLSIYELKCVCFDITNTIVKVASELGLYKYIGNLENIVNFQSLKQLEKSLQSIAVIICEKVEEERESHHNQLQQEIFDYIHTHFKMYDLSLEKLAQHLQLSPPYLSRYIKEKLGITFTQYVFNLRIEEVKKKLVETDKLIKDIILDVGYQDVSNFTRQFRKSEGITPGRYRKLNKK